MRATRGLLAALAAVLMAITAYAVAIRIAYPFELEWMEGAMAVHVGRLLRGQPLYVEPTLAFVPFAYPPLYYYVCAPIALLTGEGFAPLRMISVAATMMTALSIASIVRRVSGAVAAWAACGAFAGAYALSDAWFDLGRVDALYVALLAATYLAAIRAATRIDWALAGALAALAFMTKQPAVVALAPLALRLLIVDRRAALFFCGSFAALSAAILVILWIATDGWYSYYVFHLPALRLRVSPRSARTLSFWTSDLLPFAIGLGMGVAIAIGKREWRHIALVTGLILSAWMSRLEGGAWNNTVIPAYLACAILLGLSLRPELPAPLLRHALAAGQLVILLYDPRAFIPTAQHRVEGEAFRESLRTMNAPVWVLDHSFWPTQAGRREFAHGWAITDVVWADRSAIGKKLEAEIRDAIAHRNVATIVLDDERSWFFADIAAQYHRAGELRGPRPLSGAPRQPRFVYQK